MTYPLRYLSTGHIHIEPEDDCERIVDAMLESDYSEEFCLARDLDEDFIARLMEAGFLVMSGDLFYGTSMAGNIYILLPKLHLVRSVLFFEDLHIKKNVRKLLSKYELRIDTDFDLVLDKCVETHGSDWLTPPLVAALKNLHCQAAEKSRKEIPIKPVSFELYRDDDLKAAEIGVICGRVYTSYSGYCTENNSGTVQMILMTKWLSQNDFAFLDFGMPLDYKSRLGAKDISPAAFVELFREARG